VHHSPERAGHDEQMWNSREHGQKRKGKNKELFSLKKREKSEAVLTILNRLF
jgi:hypothetical protein